MRRLRRAALVLVVVLSLVLFGVVNPFLADPAVPVSVAFLAGTATLGVLAVVRLRRRRGLAA
jgi:hypothetical protein